ncbi:hypothetical protein BD626DRAFT_625817, partial [Schizophyllum amplum]
NASSAYTRRRCVSPRSPSTLFFGQSASAAETTRLQRVRWRRLVQQQGSPDGERPYVVVFNLHLDFFAPLSRGSRLRDASHTSSGHRQATPTLREGASRKVRP